jgi:hypothetical protein
VKGTATKLPNPCICHNGHINTIEGVTGGREPTKVVPDSERVESAGLRLHSLA